MGGADKRARRGSRSARLHGTASCGDLPSSQQRGGRLTAHRQHPFRLYPARPPRLPVLISSPHSGTFLPAEARARLACDEEALRQLDDGPVHLLFAGAPERGAAMLAATHRRAYVDLNRDPREIDPALLLERPDRSGLRLSLRVRAGLGVVPSRLGSRHLHRRPLGMAEIADRLERVHRPYHRELERRLEELRRAFGVAVLLDVHSMPASAARVERRLVDVAIGDCHGRAAGGELAATTMEILRGAGLVAVRNRPFAGGYITEHYGRPQEEIHALQLEVRRDLFMDEACQDPHEGTAALAPVFTRLVVTLAELARETAVPGRLLGPVA